MALLLAYARFPIFAKAVPSLSHLQQHLALVVGGGPCG
jgi:hypothetical protein